MHILADEDGSLIDLLLKMSPQSSKTTLRSWLKDGRVTVDDQCVKLSGAQVKKSQKISVSAKQQFGDHALRVMYEDRDLIAIEKPVGLLSVATAFEKEKTAHALLKIKFRPRPVYVVHRLDQDTSGVMIFALSERAYLKLKDVFAEHEIERKYCAIVEGNLRSDSGTWESLLCEDANYRVHATQDPQKGRLAATHYRVEGRSSKYTRLELKLETGRKNQIRVHCTDAGHPVVGDKKYNSSENPLHRLCLHAFLLALKHPVTNEPLRFESPVPAIFNRLVKNQVFDA